MTNSSNTALSLDYDYSICRDLANSAPRNDKTYSEAVKYFHDRVFYTHNGLVYYYGLVPKKRKDGTDYEELELLYEPKDKFEKNKRVGFSSQLVQAIQAETRPYKEVYEFADYRIDKENRKINAAREVYAATLTCDVGKAGKKYVDYFKKYVWEVLASKNEKLYNVIINNIATIVQLKKSDVALIIVTSEEGVGKSTLIELLSAMLGEWHVARPTASTVTSYNWCMYGKPLVALEELQSAQGNLLFFDKIKALVTQPRFEYRQMYCDPREMPNYNNLIITSNFQLRMCGRRYCNITPSCSWKDTKGAFDTLYEFTDENVKALYEYLCSIDVSDWNGQDALRELGDAEDGDLAKIESMNNVFTWIKKRNGLLKVNEKKIRTSALYEEYKASMKLFNEKPMSSTAFHAKLKELGIEHYKCGGYWYFDIDGEALFALLKKRRYILEEEVLDARAEFGAPEQKVDEEKVQLQEENKKLKEELTELTAKSAKVSEYVDKYKDAKKKNKDLESKNAQLESELEQLKKQLAELTKPKPQEKPVETHSYDDVLFTPSVTSKVRTIVKRAHVYSEPVTIKHRDRERV